MTVTPPASFVKGQKEKKREQFLWGKKQQDPFTERAQVQNLLKLRKVLGAKWEVLFDSRRKRRGWSKNTKKKKQQNFFFIFPFFSFFLTFSPTGLKRSEHSWQVLVHGQLLAKKRNERIISRERLKSNKEKGHQPGGPCIWSRLVAAWHLPPQSHWIEKLCSRCSRHSHRGF